MKYSKEIYDKDVLIKAAYCFLNRAYVHLDTKENYYVVTIHSKQENDSCDYENEFENELLAQQARKMIAIRTKNIRELIAARALSSTIVELEDELQEEESAYNSADILRDWFEEEHEQ